MSLTIKQKAFADYFIETGNATEAYIKAGYKKFKSAGVQASKTLKNPNIKNYIDQRLKKIENGRIATSKEVMEYLTSVMRGESLSEIIVEGTKIQKHPDEKERLKAAELIGKRYGLFTEKPENDEPISIKIIKASEKENGC